MQKRCFLIENGRKVAYFGEKTGKK